MLHRRLVFLYLLILFVGMFAQPNDPDDEDEPELNNQRQPSVDRNNVPSRLSPNKNNDDDDAQKPVPRQRPVNPPPPPPPQQPRSLGTPLASSPECQFDVQKYCNRGSQQVISNLKVLQCIDDLDNVSF